MRKAFEAAEGPVVIWLKPETRLLEQVPEARGDGYVTALKHAISTYDTEKVFLLWVLAPNNGCLLTVPLHDPIYSGDKPVQPVRFTIDTESIVTEIVVRVCAWCSNRSGHLALCQRCRCVRYCDDVCQKAHWPQHKKTCNKV